MEIRTEVRDEYGSLLLSTYDGPNELIDRYKKTMSKGTAAELARQRVAVKRFLRYMKSQDGRKTISDDEAKSMFQAGGTKIQAMFYEGVEE